MNQRKSWFGGRPSITEEQAKEQAAKITREADIHRLYDAGTQREVLDELYNPEEVTKCIAKIEEEKAMLALAEASKEVEPPKYKADHEAAEAEAAAEAAAKEAADKEAAELEKAKAAAKEASEAAETAEAAETEAPKEDS